MAKCQEYVVKGCLIKPLFSWCANGYSIKGDAGIRMKRIPTAMSFGRKGLFAGWIKQAVTVTGCSGLFIQATLQ